MQILNTMDTSIKRPISGQSTLMVKGCTDIRFDVLDTIFSYWRAFVICKFLQESSNVKEGSLYVIWNAHTVVLLYGAGIEYILSGMYEITLNFVSTRIMQISQITQKQYDKWNSNIIIIVVYYGEFMCSTKCSVFNEKTIKNSTGFKQRVSAIIYNTFYPYGKCDGLDLSPICVNSNCHVNARKS